MHRSLKVKNLLRIFIFFPLIVYIGKRLDEQIILEIDGLQYFDQSL